MNRSPLFVFLVLLMVLSGVTAAQDSPLPHFEPTETCFVSTPEDINVTCGYVLTREDRNTESGIVKLAVMVYHPAERTAPDPVILLEGGPGGSGLLLMTYAERIAPFLATGRDVIVFDQRGTGFSEPFLGCSGGGGVRFDVPFPSRVFAQFYSGLIADCGKALSAKHNLSAYTSADSAADIVDIADALGYGDTPLNLYGVSYGGRLALTTLREYSPRLRSVILDSSLIPQAAYGSLSTLDHALTRLFEACSADEACNAAYPDLAAQMPLLVNQFNAQPITLTVTTENGDSTTFYVNGGVLTGALMNALYHRETIALLPGAIYSARAGDYTLLGEVLKQLYASESSVTNIIAQGMQYAVNCAEDVAFTTQQALIDDMAQYPTLQYPMFTAYQEGEFVVDTCAAFPTRGVNPIENEAVHSDVPTLIVSGQYDPITPPAWGQEAAQTLSNNTYVLFNGMGHGILGGSECAAQIMQAFVNAPQSATDTACAATESAPSWVIIEVGTLLDAPTSPVEQPATMLQPVELVDIQDENGDTFRIPQGWVLSADMPGAYTQPNAPFFSLTQQFTGAPNPIFVMPSLMASFGLTAVPDVVSTIETDSGLTWSTYRARKDGIAFDFALTTAPTGVYLAVLSSLPSERDTAYEMIFVPALKGFIPAKR